MNAAILNSRNQVIGLILGLDQKIPDVSICTEFTAIKTVKRDRKNYAIAKMFEKAEWVTEPEIIETELESPVNSRGYRLSYSMKNIEKAEKTRRYAMKIKCLDYPEGFYCWDDDDC